MKDQKFWIKKVGDKVRVMNNYEVPYDYRDLIGKISSFTLDEYATIKTADGKSFLAKKMYLKQEQE